jgi:hypothetical protein
MYADSLTRAFWITEKNCGTFCIRWATSLHGASLAHPTSAFLNYGLTKVYFVSTFEAKQADDDDPRKIPFLKEYTVFNIAQTDGLLDTYKTGEAKAISYEPIIFVPLVVIDIRTCRDPLGPLLVVNGLPNSRQGVVPRGAPVGASVATRGLALYRASVAAGIAGPAAIAFVKSFTVHDEIPSMPYLPIARTILDAGLPATALTMATSAKSL